MNGDKDKQGALLFSKADLQRLLIPLLIDQFLQSFVGLADSIMVANVGEAAVSGVSLVDTVMLLVINIFTAAATGGAVIAGQYMGKKRREMACKASNELLLFTLKASLGVTILGYLGREFIIRTVFGEIEADVLYNSRVYMTIVFASIPMIALYNAGIAIFRAMGNSSVAMKTSIMMNGINIGGNALLIYGFHRGVEGAAIPTVVSRTAACLVILWLLKDQRRQIHIFFPFSFKTDKTLLKKILYIGIPNGLENSMFQLGKILVLSMVSSFGTASIAANAVCNNIATFCVLPGMAMGYGLLTVVSQCVGAGDYGQARYYTKKLTKLVYFCLMGTNILVILLLPFILQVYGLSEEAGVYVYRIMIFYSVCAVTIWPPSFFLPNALRAAADVKFAMVFSIMSMWIFRIGFCGILSISFGLGLYGVWLAMGVDWLFRGVCFGIRYVRGKWERGAIV